MVVFEALEMENASNVLFGFSSTIKFSLGRICSAEENLDQVFLIYAILMRSRHIICFFIANFLWIYGSLFVICSELMLSGPVWSLNTHISCGLIRT